MMIYRCNWCGKEIDWKKQGLPPGWRKLEYDAIKYTEEFDEATVCSLDCEVRLAQKYGAGGFR
jgi:DNA-directed RNA polymerase subunit RPC12/RpoP